MTDIPIEPIFNDDVGEDTVFDGDVILRDRAGRTRLRLDHDDGNIVVFDTTGEEVMRFAFPAGDLRLGGRGQAAVVALFAGEAPGLQNPADAAILAEANDGSLRIGKFTIPGVLALHNGFSGQSIGLEGEHGRVTAGGRTRDGEVLVRDGDDREIIRLDAEHGRLSIRNREGVRLLDFVAEEGELRLRRPDGGLVGVVECDGANIRLGGRGADGDILLFPADANDLRTDGRATLHLSGDTARAELGARGRAGSVRLRSEVDETTVELSGADGSAALGGRGADGRLRVFPRGATETGSDGQAGIVLDGERARITLGGNGEDGDILVFPGSIGGVVPTEASIRLNGSTGDIILQNADFAEDFDLADADAVEPGTVVVIGEDGRLVPCARACDTRVVGVVSGALDLKPGLILDRTGGTGRQPVALVGKVHVRATAAYGAIRAGDLLTTSPTEGVAMRVSDPAAAAGAILGKALADLPDGQGLIRALVALQ